jgi:hypothetical protein
MPAATLPTAPDAIVANATSVAAIGAEPGRSVDAKLACRNTPIQAHIA